MKKILIVDDSMVARMFLSGMLVDLGYEVVEAANGNEALKVLSSQSPDLMIMDLLMPEMSGIDLLVRLNTQQALLPIIVLSADVQTPTEEKCFHLGARAFIHKPISREKLRDVVEQLLKQVV